jgi:catechol 2,3-dioxygenase-like lactoylglutathione lyase family enzyme
MFDHLAIGVDDLAASRAFYEAALAPLGFGVVVEAGDRAVAFGPPARSIFWLRSDREPAAGIHVAFQADARESVDAFHAAALAADGKDNGGPGLRLNYHPHYYAAFAYDPDGNNIEAVCHTPQ